MGHQNTNSHLSRLQTNHNNGQAHTRWSEGLVGSPFCVTITNEIDAAKNTTEYLCICARGKWDILPLLLLFQDILPLTKSVKYLTFVLLLKAADTDLRSGCICQNNVGNSIKLASVFIDAIFAINGFSVALHLLEQDFCSTFCSVCTV